MSRVLAFLALFLPALAWAQSTPPAYGPGSVSTGGGGGSVSITSTSACLVVAPSPITGTGTVSETLPNRTVTTSPTIGSGDMCGAIFSNVSGGGTLTIPAISSTVFANGMTTTVVNYSASVEAVSTTPTINAGGGCVSASGIPAGATWTLAGNGGAALDCIQTVSTGGTPPTGANPSATAGPSAVNGSASTFMRSDGAPAVQKGTNAQFGVVEGDGVTFTCVAGVCSAIGGAATTITPGTTTIVGATAPCYIQNSTGTTMACVAGTGGSTTIIPPQGRLTCTTGVPVMTADVTACTTVYYDAFKGGNQVPVYSGSADVVLTIGAGEISDALPASSTGVLNASDVFDIWAISSSGTLTLCHATNGSGGGWASDTGGSITARGTGYSQLDTSTRAYITNKNALTHCYNGATDKGSISANQATYLGSLYTTAAGTTKMVMAPSPTAGGNNSCMCLFNAYQQAQQEAASYDSTANWTYGTNTWRASDAGATGSGLNNRVSWVDGLGQSKAYADHYAAPLGGVNAFGSGTVGVTFDSSSATPVGVIAIAYGGNNTSNPGGTIVAHSAKIAAGFHYAQAMELQSGGTSSQWNGVVNGAQSEAITLRIMN